MNTPSSTPTPSFQKAEPAAVSPWFDAVPDTRTFDSLKKNVSVDVAIIGGGIVGIIAARELAQHGKSVVLLEKNHLATGDTGLTTAFLTRVPEADLDEVRTVYGDDAARQLMNGMADAQDYIRGVIEAEKIECEMHECSTHLFAYAEGDARIAAQQATYAQLGIEHTVVKGDAVRQLAPQMAEAIELSGDMRVHIRKLLFGIVEKLKQNAQVQIYEETEVTHITHTRRHVELTTRGGRVKAKQVVVATGMPHAAYAEVHPLLTHNLTYVIAARFSGDAGVPIADALFWDVDEPYFYFRRLDENTIILGGRDRPAKDAQPPQQAYDELRAYAEKYFGAEFDVTHQWSGSLFATQDGLPFISVHPEFGNRVVIASGFSGTGMIMGILAGRLAADCIAGKENVLEPLFSFARLKEPLKLKPHVEQKVPAAKPGSGGWQKGWMGTVARIAILALYIVALIVPGYLFFSPRGGAATFLSTFLSMRDVDEGKIAALLLFPLFGLYAFTFLWVQFMTGTFMRYIRPLFKRIEVAHRMHGVFILLFALCHPLLLTIGIGVEAFLGFEYILPELQIFVFFGMTALLMLLLIVVSTLLRRRSWMRRYWQTIHLLSYVALYIVWFHAWFVGSDVRLGGLRLFWAVTGVCILGATALRLFHWWQKKHPKKKTASSASTAVANYTRVASVNDMKEGQPLCVELNGEKIALFQVGDAYYAINNTCTHAGGPLCEGKIDGNIVQCPWYGARFDVTTGKVVGPPAQTPVTKYRVRKKGDDIEIAV